MPVRPARGDLLSDNDVIVPDRLNQRSLYKATATQSTFSSVKEASQDN